MAKMKRRIKVTDDQWFGCGYYQTVYRISQRRIVKIAKVKFKPEHQKEILKSEIEGSKTLMFALPVLEVVDVELPTGEVVEGTLRRYIPNEINDYEFDELDNKYNFDGTDNHRDNFRLDSRGNIWRTDTQLNFPC